MSRRAVAVVALSTVGVLAVATLLRSPATPNREAAKQQHRFVEPTNGVTSILVSEDKPPYPDDWLVSARAAASAKLNATLPESDIANSNNATSYYASPDGTMISASYPLATPPAAPVRQDYIEVWASTWSRGDPTKEFQRVLDETKIQGAYISGIDGTPTMDVTAHAPDDLNGQNPAIVWFVISDVQYQVSGGDNLDDLNAIAKDIIGRATA